MEEYHANDALSKVAVSSSVLHCCESNPNSEGADHSGVGCEEERATSNPVDHESEEDCFNPISRSDDAIESVLESRICNASVGQDLAEVVSCQASAAELSKTTAADADEESHPVPL